MFRRSFLKLAAALPLLKKLPKPAAPKLAACPTIDLGNVEGTTRGYYDDDDPAISRGICEQLGTYFDYGVVTDLERNVLGPRAAVYSWRRR